jgi:hypothetical protein
MPQFSQLINNGINVSLVTFGDGELSALNSTIEANHSVTIFSSGDLSTIADYRARMNDLAKQGLIDEAAIYNARGTALIIDRLQKAGFGIAITSVIALWSEVSPLQRIENPIAVNKQNFEQTQRSWMRGQLTSLLETDSRQTFIRRLQTDPGLDISPAGNPILVGLTKAALGASGPLHETPKYVGLILTVLNKYKYQSPQPLVDNIYTGLSVLSEPDLSNFIAKMNLTDLWNVSLNNLDNFRTLLLNNLNDKTTLSPGGGSVSQATFALVVSSLAKNFDLADPYPDQTRLIIANILLSGTYNFRASSNINLDILQLVVANGDRKSVLDFLMTTALTAIDSDVVANIDNIFRPIADSAYGAGSTANFPNFINKQQSSLVAAQTLKDNSKAIVARSGPVQEASLNEQKQRALGISKKELEARKDALMASQNGLSFLQDIGGFAVGADVRGLDNAANLIATQARIQYTSGLDASNPLTKGTITAYNAAESVIRDTLTSATNGYTQSVQSNARAAFGELLKGNPAGAWQRIQAAPGSILKSVLDNGTKGLSSAFNTLGFPIDDILGLSNKPKALPAISSSLNRFLGLKAGIALDNDTVQVLIDDSWINNPASRTDRTKAALPKPTISLVDPTFPELPFVFELLPSVKPNLPVNRGGDGADVPWQMPGITYKHVQNIATITVPGGAPVYQSLGISGEIIEFSGMILSYGGRKRGKGHDKGRFPFGTVPFDEMDPPQTAAKVNNNTTEQTENHAFGAYAQSEDILLAMTRSGKPVKFTINYNALNAQGDDTKFIKELTCLLYKVERISPRKDKMYYKISMLRIEYPEQPDVDRSAEASLAKEVAQKKVPAKVNKDNKVTPPVDPTAEIKKDQQQANRNELANKIQGILNKEMKIQAVPTYYTARVDINEPNSEAAKISYQHLTRIGVDGRFNEAGAFTGQPLSSRGRFLVEVPTTPSLLFNVTITGSDLRQVPREAALAISDVDAKLNKVWQNVNFYMIPGNEKKQANVEDTTVPNVLSPIGGSNLLSAATATVKSIQTKAKGAGGTRTVVIETGKNATPTTKTVGTGTILRKDARGSGQGTSTATTRTLGGSTISQHISQPGDVVVGGANGVRIVNTTNVAERIVPKVTEAPPASAGWFGLTNKTATTILRATGGVQQVFQAGVDIKDIFEGTTKPYVSLLGVPIDSSLIQGTSSLLNPNASLEL